VFIRGEGARLGRRLGSRVCATALALLAAVACGGSAQPVANHATPATSAAPAAVVGPLADWQKLGATEVPPASVLRVSLGAIQVVDQTGGAVSEADAKLWATALLRSISYDFWAVNRQQSDFLGRSGLASAPTTVFGPDFAVITQARAAQARAQYQGKTIRRLVLRPVPANLKKAFQDQGFIWSQYAFFIDAVGPASIAWTDSQGKHSVQQTLAPGAAASELAGGQFSHDPVMGDIWAVGSDWDCTSAPTRQTLAPLCNS
jgi:hypothetical protein